MFRFAEGPNSQRRLSIQFRTVCSWCGHQAIAADDDIQVDVAALGTRVICAACTGKMLAAVDAAIASCAAIDDDSGVFRSTGPCSNDEGPTGG